MDLLPMLTLAVTIILITQSNTRLVRSMVIMVRMRAPSVVPYTIAMSSNEIYEATDVCVYMQNIVVPADIYLGQDFCKSHHS